MPRSAERKGLSISITLRVSLSTRLLAAPQSRIGQNGSHKCRKEPPKRGNFRVVTSVRAVRCREERSVRCRRWYDGGGTGVVGNHGTGTIANLHRAGTSRVGGGSLLLPAKFGNTLEQPDSCGIVFEVHPRLTAGMKRHPRARINHPGPARSTPEIAPERVVSARRGGLRP